MKNANTLERGSIRCIVFRDHGTWYGVGLEFNIVETGDTPQEALLLLSEAAQGYVESARKLKARPAILNQQPDQEYVALWDQLENQKARAEQLKSVYYFGRLNVGASLVPA